MSEYAGRVLIVDDEINIRAGLRDVLIRDGHIVSEAGSGKEVLRFLESAECEVAVLDIRMPDMSGIELLKLIRDRWSHIAVIMLTGHGTLETAMVAVKAGAHDYLLKPARSEAIRQTLSSAIETSRRRRTQAQLMDTLRASPLWMPRSAITPMALQTSLGLSHPLPKYSVLVRHTHSSRAKLLFLSIICEKKSEGKAIVLRPEIP